MLTATNAAMMELCYIQKTYFEHVLVQITRNIVDPIIIYYLTAFLYCHRFSEIKCSFSKAGSTVASHCDVNNYKENRNTGSK